MESIYCCFNGTGKTTLIDILTGVINEDVTGGIFYNNLNSNYLDMYYIRKNLISLVQQEPQFSNNKIKVILHQMVDIKTQQLLINKIELLGLSDLYLSSLFDIRSYWDRNINELSGGEKQKFAILLAALKDPNVLILDEPTSALDTNSVDAIKQILRRMVKDRIVILITHDMRLINVSDAVLNMANLKSKEVII